MAAPWTAPVLLSAKLAQAKRKAAARVFYCERVSVPAAGGRTARRWRFTCPHCQREHTHSPYPGHREAHCADGPFKVSGYVIVLRKKSHDPH